MPMLKAIHICNSHNPTLQPKIAKEYSFAYADGQKVKKYDRTTKAIRNAGKVLNMNIIPLNKISVKLKNNRFKNPHYA